MLFLIGLFLVILFLLTSAMERDILQIKVNINLT